MDREGLSMDDLISRQAAIDILAIGDGLLSRALDEMDVVGVERDKFEWGLGLIDSYIEDFKELPSAQQWIPCSERLPDSWNERYLVSLAWGGVGTMEYKSTGFHNYGSFSPVPIETVTAWMPLPEPYKGEES